MQCDANAKAWLEAEWDAVARTIVQKACATDGFSAQLSAHDLRQATRHDASTEWLARKLASAEAAPASPSLAQAGTRVRVHPLFLSNDLEQPLADQKVALSPHLLVVCGESDVSTVGGSSTFET